MLIARRNERNATRAAFAADRDRLFGGQHRVEIPDGDNNNGTWVGTVCSIPSKYTSQGLGLSNGRGS
jgi:hypothetical protein